MATLQNQYQVLKLKSDFIVARNLNVENYSKSQAAKDGALVSIGDNLVFQQIRKFYDDKRTHREIFNDVQQFRRAIRAAKREGKNKEANILNRFLVDSLFVKDIVNVEVVKKKEYKELAKNGFTVNGIHYVRFCCGSGQMRRNTITFINDKLYDTLYKNLMCGLDTKITEMNLAKYHAYFALAFSSVMWVRNPRVCVVKDFHNVVKDQKVDWICPDPATGKKHIEERTMDIDLNCADGQGLVDPQFAALWAEDMNLSYVPSSFVVRSVFVKGCLVPFDFKEFAAEHGIDSIRDKWGIAHRLEDIDVILSESQFKMHKYYVSWYEYQKYADAAGIQWGVARYNKKYDDEYVLANYQYLQVLNIDKADILKLIQPTVDWIKKICTGDPLYTMLYMLGCKGEQISFKELYNGAQSTALKAIIKNPMMLDDAHVQKKVYRNIAETINKAKIGKVWVRGNYSFMISDPVAQCQSALGLEPTGLIGSDEVYSNFWRHRGVGCVDLCRSPMIDSHEHNPCKVVSSADMDYWYQYIESGIIYSIYDTSTLRHSDSDFDGDVVMSTDNEIFIKGAQKWHNVITYEKGAAPVQKICLKNSIATDLRGLGTGVGGFSNCATIMHAMKGIFQKDSQKEQRDELTLRIKLLREIVGQEIDRIKGTAAPELPKEWKKTVRINNDDTDAVKADKYKRNSMVIAKKPYFFRYLYPELNQQFKQYEDSYNMASKEMFGAKFKKLLVKPNKTEEEMNLVRRYQKYSPLITAPCIMNLLCKEFENVDFDINFSKGAVSMLPTFEDEFEVDGDRYKQVKELYRKFSARKQVKVLESILENADLPNRDEYDEIRFAAVDLVREEIREAIGGLNISSKELLFYCSQLSKEYRQFNWDFAWDILGDSIVDLIPRGRIEVPVKNEVGFDYLGDKYVLAPITEEEAKVIQEEEVFDDFSWDDLLGEDMPSIFDVTDNPFEVDNE
nr:MAG TPA: RNA-dependent RNA polymerase [Caudoviricetes sp.]